MEGKADSQVRVIIYEDLQCSDCAVFGKMLDRQILPRYAGRVEFAHRDFPLVKHAWARRAAAAAKYFGEIRPELGLAYRRQTMASLADITVENFNGRLLAFAAQNGLDAAPALASIEDKRIAGLVENDFQDGVAHGVSKTPTVFVNGRPFIETISFEEFSRALDEELKL
jgi:protein-disulfide isomerase